MTRDYHKFIDAKGLKCPQPLLQTKLAIKSLKPQQILLLEATDAHTDLDLEVWCQRFGHTLIATHKNDGVFQFWIQKV